MSQYNTIHCYILYLPLRLLNITTTYLVVTSFFFQLGLESRDKLGSTIYSYTR